MRCEIVLPANLNRWGKRLLSAMLESAPIRTRPVQSPSGAADMIMMYGIGEPVRRKLFYAHVASGRTAIGWDLGYWDRDWEGVGKMRVTINADHPQKWIRRMPNARFDADNLELRDDYHPDGHIVLVGLGRKQIRAMGVDSMAWERKTLDRIRKFYPTKRVIFRPKKDPFAALPGCQTAGTGPIKNVLRQASLVVCQHSNVAVDACFAGIPVVCEDGAAAAIYSNDMGNPVRPSRAKRLRFLRDLAWWQWSHTEAPDAWKFLLGVLNGKV